jgi:hypothetical protein
MSDDLHETIAGMDLRRLERERVHPLRLAYMRTLQAVLAVHCVRFDVDASLGGDPCWLDEIEASLTEAQRLISRLAVAERINLGADDE